MKGYKKAKAPNKIHMADGNTITTPQTPKKSIGSTILATAILLILFFGSIVITHSLLP